MDNMEAQEEMAAEETAASTATRPAASFTGTGGINVAVWKRKAENGLDNFSIKIERNYKDSKDGNYKSTPYLRDVDLLRVQKLLSQADDWIEQEKSKQRAASSNRTR